MRGERERDTPRLMKERERKKQIERVRESESQESGTETERWKKSAIN